MWRYPDETINRKLPPKVNDNGVIRMTKDLDAVALDALGYNQAIRLTRDPFTTYTTEWVKDGLVYHEEAITAVVDEEAKAEYEKNARVAEIDTELAEIDKFLPRSVEDLIESGAIESESLSQYNQDRLDRKIELRAELSTLYTAS